MAAHPIVPRVSDSAWTCGSYSAWLSYSQMDVLAPPAWSPHKRWKHRQSSQVVGVGVPDNGLGPCWPGSGDPCPDAPSID